MALTETPLSRRILLWLTARLAPGTAFGLHLTAGVLLLAAMTMLFAVLAGNVARLDGLAAFDVRISQWLHGIARSAAWQPLTSLMLLLTHVHSVPGMVLLSGILARWLWRRRERYWLLALSLAVPGGMLLNVALKHIYQRARPVFEAPLVNLPTYSFPSGHTSSATLLYGLLAAYVVMAHRRYRVPAVSACVLMVVLVGVSRIYLGAHYPTDIAGAMLAGVGWLAACITAVATWRRCS